MSFKLLALDLDDTLLNENNEISPRNREAILEATRRGVTVTLATGRMFRSALPYAEELGLNVPLITYHGAMVKTARTKEEIYHCPVPLEQAREITTFAEEEGLHLNLYINDKLYVREENEMTSLYISIAGVDYTCVGNLTGFLNEGPTKITVIIKEESKIKDLWKLLNQKYKDILFIAQSRPYFLEITHSRATKGQALKSLAESIGLQKNETIAVGDSYNDIDMIEYAGMGAAVENAREEVKKTADYITTSNLDDGVAELIEKFILK